jgi:hypothetical protein
VLRSALSLEIMGMKRRGRSVYAIIKDEFGLRGSRQSVLTQLSQHIVEKQKERENEKLSNNG